MSSTATGIGMNAVSTGYKVLFVNAKDLVDQLHEKMLEGTLREMLEELWKIPLLIVDELSYLKMDRERESLFFQVIRQRYEKSLHAGTGRRDIRQSVDGDGGTGT